MSLEENKLALCQILPVVEGRSIYILVAWADFKKVSWRLKDNDKYSKIKLFNFTKTFDTDAFANENKINIGWA